MENSVKSLGQLCPLSGQACNRDCAWLRGELCAVSLLAGEAYAALEAYCVVNRLKTNETTEGNDNDKQ